tara:strand:+ start:1663 stop:1782 length:120 start_codon:yes stop_codon:yes gene_type:complete
MYWPAIAVCALLAAFLWAGAAVIIGVRYDRLRRKVGLSA